MGLMSRPGLLSLGSRHHLRSRPGLFSQGEEAMSRHPLRSRHGAGCLVLCTVQVTVWTLFMNTVHEHCSQGKNNNNNNNNNNLKKK